MATFSFFRKKQPIETRRSQRDLLADRSATPKAREAATELALEAASDTALAKAEGLIRQCEDRERTLRDAIAVFDSELAEQVAAEAAAADRKLREATARDLRGRADRIEKGLPPLLDAVRNSAAAIETSRPIVGEIGMFHLFHRLEVELPPAFALIAGELRARAAMTLDGRAPPSLPTPEVIPPKPARIPRQRVFFLKDAKWRDPETTKLAYCERYDFAELPVALAAKALESGVAIPPDSARIQDVKHLRRGAPPIPEKCVDLDIGELPKPAGPVPWDAFRTVDRRPPTKAFLPPVPSFEPSAARHQPVPDNEPNHGK